MSKCVSEGNKRVTLSLCLCGVPFLSPLLCSSLLFVGVWVGVSCAFSFSLFLVSSSLFIQHPNYPIQSSPIQFNPIQSYPRAFRNHQPTSHSSICFIHPSKRTHTATFFHQRPSSANVPIQRLVPDCVNDSSRRKSLHLFFHTANQTTIHTNHLCSPPTPTTDKWPPTSNNTWRKHSTNRLLLHCFHGEMLFGFLTTVHPLSISTRHEHDSWKKQLNLPTKDSRPQTEVNLHTLH